jgi:hypothetical protein
LSDALESGTRWRSNFIRWQGKAEAANQEIRSAATNRTW